MARLAWVPAVAVSALGVLLLAGAAWFLDVRLYLQAMLTINLGLQAVPDRARSTDRDRVANMVESDRVAYVLLVMLLVVPISLIGIHFTVGLDADAVMYTGAGFLHVLLLFNAHEAWRKLKAPELTQPPEGRTSAAHA